ncbi:Cloroperoxidase [Myriangium duriaei CBS 260.36]|uniref:Cloroperoxidase n=1 Tax=Myriangium duriaei CBS 260.36 TaxID=1168546 RepID=A0A9P4ITY9_9PEZI|nr:Cloroperoxidase [Myriangium duriaei CBS 260.36]
MKVLNVVPLLAVGAHAYPDIVAHLAERQAAHAGKPIPKRAPIPFVYEAAPFNASQQYISNQGQYKFVAPGPTDQRGPCPGLNAMANHGYLPHDGIATIPEFISSTNKVFGMGVDLGTFLAIYGSVFDGDLTKWSIGGPDSRVSTLGLGIPQGISGSHNKYEGDASPTRGDLYVSGNDYKLQLKQFEALYDLAIKNGDKVDLQLLTDYRYTRFQEGITGNPYFFNAPFSGVLAQPAAWTFIFRFMGNKSAEYPAGYLNTNVLKSFYAITGDRSNFQYTPGYERIPDNWYTRNALDPYSIPFLEADTINMALQHPEFASIGGNTGQPNTYTAVDPGDLTGGVFNGATLLQGNNLFCYAMEVTVQEAPDILSGLFTDVNAAQDALGAAINAATNSLGCPKLNNIDKSQFNKYPGFTKLNQKTGSY